MARFKDPMLSERDPFKVWLGNDLDFGPDQAVFDRLVPPDGPVGPVQSFEYRDPLQGIFESIGGIVNANRNVRVNWKGRPQSTNIEDRRNGATTVYNPIPEGFTPHFPPSRLGPSTGLTKAVIDTIIAEAGDDPEGQAAVAAVILNRARKKGKTPDQIVKEKSQFEGYENPGYGSQQAKKDPKVRARAEDVFRGVATGKIADPTGGGIMFHADSMTPYWAKAENKNGTVNIGGNVFYKGSGASNSALAAINAVAPTPMPSRPVALSYAQNTSTPAPTAPSVPTVPPKMRQMIEKDASFGVLPFSKTFNPGMYPLDGQGIDLNARDLSGRTDFLVKANEVQKALPTIPRIPAPQMSAARATSSPARGVGTSYLAPATKVKTVPIDPVTGNPIVAQATPSPRSTVGYGPDWNNLQGMTAGAWDDAAPWNDVGPRPKPFVGGVVPSQSKQTPQQIANERVLAGIPVIGPLAIGVGSALDLVKNRPSAGAVASPQPQPTKLPSVIPEKAGPPAPPRSVPKADTSVGSFITQFGTNTGKPAPLAPKPPKSTDKLVAGDVQKDAFVKTYYPDMYSPEAIKRGQDIASALYPKPSPPSALAAINAATLPRLPMMPTAAMSAARLPTVPVRTAPIPAARIPLTQTRTVNPMTQIVPAVQARAGQGLFGRLFNAATAEHVPQANLMQGNSTPRPAWQNNPNVQRDDKWAGVLDNFGMII